MNDTFDIFLHMNLTGARRGGMQWRVARVLLPAANTMWLGTSERCSQQQASILENLSVQRQQEYRRKQRRIEVEEGRLRIPNPKPADHLEINRKAGIQMRLALASQVCHQTNSRSLVLQFPANRSKPTLGRLAQSVERVSLQHHGPS